MCSKQRAGNAQRSNTSEGAKVPDQPRRELIAAAKLFKQLEDIREAKQMTKAEVARRLGVKRPVVSRLLAGKSTVPNLGTIADVADVLDVYIDLRIKPQPRNGKRHAAIEVHEAAARSHTLISTAALAVQLAREWRTWGTRVEVDTS